jgi:hypothetical protein
MVTNGEYLAFLQAGEGDERPYEDAKLWRRVWQKCRVKAEPVPLKTPMGVAEKLEPLDREGGALMAVLDSLRSEARRALGASPVEAAAAPASTDDSFTISAAGPHEGLVRRVFAGVKHLLRRSLCPPQGAKAGSVLTHDEHRLLTETATVGKLLGEVEKLRKELRSAYKTRVDSRHDEARKRGDFPEVLQFLTRFAAEAEAVEDLKKGEAALRNVLYPRGWTSPSGSPAGEDAGAEVPWEAQPVYGVTLYEALAYASWAGAWLPSEAQMERASSWPAEPLPPEGPIVVDAFRKLALPWEDHNPSRDFHSFFGREGALLEDTWADRAQYERLLDETARVAGGEKILQLEGFGWQWTCDHHGADERKYGRFGKEYPRYAARPCREAGRQQPVEVMEYRPHAHVDDFCFVLKGSPDVLGGPGLTMRRFAASPLRAHPRIGFRLAAAEA